MRINVFCLIYYRIAQACFKVRGEAVCHKCLNLSGACKAGMSGRVCVFQVVH